jgi:hypothetical protein
MSSAISTSWLIVTNSLDPRLIGSRMSECMIFWMPSTQSSMYMNDLVCVPSPQISMVWSPDAFAAITFRQTAAGAFSRPPHQVPFGP